MLNYYLNISLCTKKKNMKHKRKEITKIVGKICQVENEHLKLF